MADSKSTWRAWPRRFAVAAFAALVLIQIIPVRRNNPPVDPSRTIYATEKVPAAVHDVFQRSCSNCHSNQTAWPWYGYVAPVSWLIAHDVRQGRSKLNLSEWGNYTAKKREERLEDICEQLTDGDMPDGLYAFFHREAHVTPQERAAICQWTEDSRQY